MINTEDVIKALAKKLRTILVGYDVVVNDIKTASDKVVSIELINSSSRFNSNGALRTTVMLDIVVYHKKKNTLDMIKTADLLTSKLLNTIEVKDRVLTISNSVDISIVDDVLHYGIEITYSEFNPSVIDTSAELLGSISINLE